MCSGDMTLIPTMWSDHIQRNYVESDADAYERIQWCLRSFELPTDCYSRAVQSFVARPLGLALTGPIAVLLYVLTGLLAADR